MGARSEAEARSWWIGYCRRRIGVAVARAMARHRLRRVPFIGVPRPVLDARARRGAAAAPVPAGAGYDDTDTLAFFTYQAHVHMPDGA